MIKSNILNTQIQLVNNMFVIYLKTHLLYDNILHTAFHKSIYEKGFSNGFDLKEIFCFNAKLPNIIHFEQRIIDTIIYKYKIQKIPF